MIEKPVSYILFAFAGTAVQPDPPIMDQDCVLDDGKTKAGAACLFAPAFIHAIKALKDTPERTDMDIYRSGLAGKINVNHVETFLNTLTINEDCNPCNR